MAVGRTTLRPLILPLGTPAIGVVEAATRVRSPLTLGHEAMNGLPESLLTIDQLSDLTQIPRATLYRWRSRGEGPPAMRLGRHLRYSPAEVDRWLQARARVDRSTVAS